MSTERQEMTVQELIDKLSKLNPAQTAAVLVDVWVSEDGDEAKWSSIQKIVSVSDGGTILIEELYV